MTANQLVQENRGFAYQRAADFLSPVSLEDRQQAALLGLVEAAQRFDPENGAKFISYAVWWIRKRLVLLQYDSSPIRVPHYARARGRGEMEFFRLDDFVHEEDGRRHVDELVADDPSPHEQVEAGDRLRAVLRVLPQLRPRQRKVIELRFGLRDGQERTLQEVGECIGVGRERVRQIQAEAFQAIRKRCAA